MNPAPPSAQDAGQDDLRTLQGEWTVAAAEQGGQPFDVIVGGALTITGDRFALLTATGHELGGQIRLDAAQTPRHLDFVHDDGLVRRRAGLLPAELRRGGPETSRPTMFVTASDTPGTVIVMER